MKKKLLISAAAAALLALILFLPLPLGSYDDGGTSEYRALTYKMVIWKRMVAESETDANGNTTIHHIGRYRKTTVFWFDEASLSIDELWALECERNNISAHLEPEG